MTAQTLARMPLFRSLDSEAIRRLDSRCVWRRVDASELILDYGDGGTDLYFVVHGHFRALMRSASGKESILRDIPDGEYFGELAAIDGLPRSAAIVAVTNSIVAKMSAAILRETLHTHPDAYDQLLSLLASQVRMLANRVNEYSTLDVRRRIYAELLRLARPARPGDAQRAISPPPTHAELAGRVSSYREAVTRELNSLEQAGIVERRRGAMVILHPDRLAELIEYARA
jgi:CRP-like cAMP-binding protein